MPVPWTVDAHRTGCAPDGEGPYRSLRLPLVRLLQLVMILQRESDKLFGQSDFGYDILIGPPKGSPLQLTLNTVYHMDVSPGVIPYQIYEDMARKTPALPGHPDYRPYVRWAVPFMVGDSYGIHGTPSPGKVSKSDSHGCVRLTNWDAERVAERVSKGTPVAFLDD